MTLEELVIEWREISKTLHAQSNKMTKSYQQGIYHGHSDALAIAANEIEAIIKTNRKRKPNDANSKASPNLAGPRASLA